MKQLVCYTVEGLLQQGPHQVWVTLGAYRSQEQAQAAQQTFAKDRIRETRVLPYFRTSDLTATPHIRPTLRPAAPVAEAIASVVA